MRKCIILILCLFASFAASGQNTRLVKGIVFNNDDIPAQGATISVVGMSGSTESNENGLFELYVSPYAKNIKVTMDGFLPQTAEIDGSYIVFKLKVDKQYAENKAREAEAARVAAEQAKAAEQARIAAEKEAAERAAIEKAKAEEEARIAAEKEAAAKAKAEERARIAAEKEAAAKAKAEERARIAAEKEAAATIKAESDNAVKAEPKEPKESKISLLANLNLGDFRSFVEVDLFTMNDYLLSNMGISYIGGFYNSDHKLFVGAGAGVGTYDFEYHPFPTDNYIDDSGYTGKLFVNAKKYFLKGFFKPYVSLSCGIEYAIRKEVRGRYNVYSGGSPIHINIQKQHISDSGFSAFAEPQIGVSFGNNFGGYVAVGYKLSSWYPTYCTEYSSDDGGYYTSDWATEFMLCGLKLSLGVTF